jgi:hypothetical protein
MLGVPDVALAGGLGFVASIVFLVVGYAYGARSAANVDIQALDDIEGAEGFEIYDTGSKGLLGSYLQEREKSKALKKGMVRWHLVGSSFEKARYIKPEREPGGSIPEVEHDGETYLFPPNAARPSQEEGVPVFVHREGESDPVELADDWELSVDAKQLKDYLDSRVSSTDPKGLGLGLGDMEPMDILKYGVLAIVLLFILIQVMNGGIA